MFNCKTRIIINENNNFTPSNKQSNGTQNVLIVCVSDVLVFLFVCLSGGGRDLDSESGAVLQTILRVHVQHLIIDSSPGPASRFLS